MTTFWLTREAPCGKCALGLAATARAIYGNTFVSSVKVCDYEKSQFRYFRSATIMYSEPHTSYNLLHSTNTREISSKNEATIFRQKEKQFCLTCEYCQSSKFSLENKIQTSTWKQSDISSFRKTSSQILSAHFEKIMSLFQSYHTNVPPRFLECFF